MTAAKCLLIVVLLPCHLVPAQQPAWGPLGSGLAGPTGPGNANALQVFDDGTGAALFAGGRFATAGGLPATAIARWDGSLWSALGPGLAHSGAGTPIVNALATLDDGTGPALYAGGSFALAGGVPANNVARWDGSVWSSLGNGLNGDVLALVAFDDGSGPTLYAGGYFTIGSTMNVARWDGASWQPVGGGLPGLAALNFVRDLLVFDDGTGPALYAGGVFAVGNTVSGVARWDGTSWSGLGQGVINYGTMAAFDDGTGPTIFAGAWSGGSPGLSSLHRWNGTSWTALGNGAGPVRLAAPRSLAVFDDGAGPALHCGGDFVQAGSTTPMVARWDGTGWTPLGTGGADDQVLDLAVFDDQGGPALHAGGEFTSLAGAQANAAARWSATSAITVSLTQPGGPGAPVFVSNANLTPGHVYVNVFSLDLCPAGPGTGPFGGLCITTPANAQLVAFQLLAPPGTPPFHFVAGASYASGVPLAVGPVTVEALCVDVTGSLIGPLSPVIRTTVL